jgi:hypothetical protein
VFLSQGTTGDCCALCVGDKRCEQWNFDHKAQTGNCVLKSAKSSPNVGHDWCDYGPAASPDEIIA